MALRIWHLLFRCRSGVQDFGFFLETTSGKGPVFCTCWFDSGYKFASVYGSLLHFSAMLGSTVDTHLRQSTVVFCTTTHAWFDSELQFASVFRIAMLGLTVDTYCRVRRLRSGMALAGMLVAMLSRCVHFVVGRPVESPQVQSLRQFQLLALPA